MKPNILKTFADGKMCWLVNVVTLTFVVSLSLDSIQAQESSSFLFESYPNCSKLQRFATSLTDFSYCSLMYTVPYNLCQKCFKEYQTLGKNYQSLKNGGVNITGDAIDTCPEDIVTRDKLKHIDSYYASSKMVWTLGNCDNCYDSNDGEVDYIVVNFYDKTSMLDACISRSARNDTCRVCNENYTQLNLYYLRLDADYGSSLCNDIVDQMNLVHVKWTNVLDCQTTSGFDYATLLIACFLAIIPLVFYVIGSYYCRTKGPTLIQQKRLSQINLQHDSDERTRLLSPVLLTSTE